MPYLNTRARELRQQLGRKPAEFAHELGMGYSHLRNGENGIAQVSIEVIHQLAHALGVSAEDLIAHDRPPNKPGPSRPEPGKPKPTPPPKSSAA